MKNKSLKKRVLFLLTCLTIIAIGICLPIVGTTLASNDTTKASPTSPSTSPIETGVKVDKNGSLINLTEELDGPRYLSNKYLPTYTEPIASSVKYNKCYDSSKYTTSLVDGMDYLPQGSSRALTYTLDCGQTLWDLHEYNPTDSKSTKYFDGIGLFGGYDYSVDIIYDYAKIYKDANPYKEDFAIASDVRMMFLNSPLTNIYSPSDIKVYASNDGKTYYSWNGTKTVKEIKHTNFSAVEVLISRDTYAKAR